MLISLQLVGTPQGPVTDEAPRRFEEGLITIGRAPNCHVVLPDSLRIISRQHARLTQQRGDVLLTCLSVSAPVRVNTANVPHGGALPVLSGDVVHIGGFDLRVWMEADAPMPEAVAVAAPATATVAVAVPVLASAPTPEPTAVPPAVPVVGPVTLRAPARAGRARLDEWFDLEPALTAGDTLAAAGRAEVPTADVDLDLIQGTQSSVVARIAEADVASGTASGSAFGAAPVIAPMASPLPPQPAARATPPPVQTARAEPPTRSAAIEHRAALPPLDDEARDALMQAFLEGAGLAQRADVTSAQVLAPMALTPEWMRHIGTLLRASVEGALALLHSRSTVKREMRAEVTVITRRQNNPLKFAPDALAALAHLVAAKRSPGFLEPVAALKDAHEDLLVHHLAVVAGMRAAMFELIARLGPDDVLRDEGPPKGLVASLPSVHEAALWRRYRQRHADMTARLDDDFEAVFGREFTKAYEAQARRVREQAPPEGTVS